MMVRLTRITTKTGDAGTTGLADGSRVAKTHPRIVAQGSVDEANAAIGVALLHLDGEVAGLLRRVQNELFDLGADLALPEAAKNDASLRVTPEMCDRLEQALEAINEQLSPLTSFILPGGSQASAYLHLARTVARRAERDVWALATVESVSPAIAVYLNRLSDLLFVLARAANDGGAGDVLWVPGGSGRENG